MRAACRSMSRRNFTVSLIATAARRISTTPANASRRIEAFSKVLTGHSLDLAQDSGSVDEVPI
jgi:hypothetical protein